MINYYIVSIKGKNVKRFLKQLIDLKINIVNIEYKEKEILLKVSYKEYEKIKKIKTSYDVRIVKVSGEQKIIGFFKRYRLSAFIFLLSVFLCIFLSNLVLFINIDTNNIELKEKISKELKKENINLFSFQKRQKDLNDISLKIKNNNYIEWISIDKKGVYLNVKVIERVEQNKNDDNNYKDIVALKNGYIRKISSSNGEILKNIDDYVEKGEVIISGNIFKNDKVVAKTKAKGVVYAEVWYIAKADRSLYYNKLNESGKGKKSLVLNILGYNINIISIPKKTDAESNKKMFSNSIFDLYLKTNKIFDITKEKYTSDELSNILLKKAKKDIVNKLDSDSYVLEEKILKKYISNDRMYIEVFFKTYENIAQEQDIKQIIEKEEIND